MKGYPYSMKFSVIVPIYNVEKYLDRCLRSLTKKIIDGVEIILVNDGSTDNSQEICEKYLNKYECVKLINKRNTGTGDSRNVGMREASGEYIYFCDPDDYIEENLFEDMANLVTSQKDVYMFGYWDEIEYNGYIVEKKEMCVNKEVAYNKAEFLENFTELFATNMLYTLWNKLYKKSFLEDYHINFSTTPMGQDTRFNLLVYRYIESFEAIEKKYYHYTIMRENSSTAKYRSNRMIMKIEEDQLLANLLSDFKVPQKNELLAKTREKIILDCGNYAVTNELPKKEQKEILQREINIFQYYFPDFESASKKIATKLLINRCLSTYIFLKKVHSRIKTLKFSLKENKVKKKS
ncbi:glycosyltransferase [Tetragenococcus halophilus]|uniref:glycosyltransferase family 2 protein n=1 Tax=Tetragenococcus halophilus TaxID=51669 RepID=UPI000CB9A381|nr:glycosyltransferase family 2 protein [Tetragenococcus halophilus]GBD80642.1 hypothetical protein TEHD10_1705 [Tetragenococcus halophilus subsp. halophilus]GMG61417.1 glycosyltransferase [Tetragenococcus halophilus]